MHLRISFYLRIEKWKYDVQAFSVNHDPSIPQIDYESSTHKSARIVVPSQPDLSENLHMITVAERLTQLTLRTA